MAYDGLADGYERAKNNTLAKQALQQGLKLAIANNSQYISHFQRRLSQLVE